AKGKVGTAELKELSVAINNMAEQIEKQETLRKQLTSDVAHELRTPLSSVSAQLEMILDGVFEPSEERLNGISEEVNRLSVLVSDLEKLQQIENNVLERAETDLFDLARSTVNLFEAEINRNDLTCTVTGNSVKVYADERKIQQVITNLLSNAVKYSHEGGAIEIDVQDGGDCAVLSVRDYGIGISEEDQKLIFERFYRTDKSRNRKTGGVGIGLTIASEIVKAHGGKIEVESLEGKGTLFTVTIPKSI
ncbi:MAG: sensor histidine kinase, partial [Candidatus Coproplasma sp.]